MKGSISNSKLQAEFRVNDSYLKSISKHSRRIVNCFLSTEKKKKYASSSQLHRAPQKQPSIPKPTDVDYEKEQQQEEQQEEQEQSKEGFFLTGA